VLFVGPRDLSHDLGVPGDLTAPAFTEAIEHVLAAGRRHGKACGLLVTDGAAAARRLEHGWTFVGIGSDSTLLAGAVTTEFGRARTVSKPRGGPGPPPQAARPAGSSLPKGGPGGWVPPEEKSQHRPSRTGTLP